MPHAQFICDLSNTYSFYPSWHVCNCSQLVVLPQMGTVNINMELHILDTHILIGDGRPCLVAM